MSSEKNFRDADSSGKDLTSADLRGAELQGDDLNDEGEDSDEDRQDKVSGTDITKLHFVISVLTPYPVNFNF